MSEEKSLWNYGIYNPLKYFENVTSRWAIKYILGTHWLAAMHTTGAAINCEMAVYAYSSRAGLYQCVWFAIVMCWLGL